MVLLIDLNNTQCSFNLLYFCYMWFASSTGYGHIFPMLLPTLLKPYICIFIIFVCVISFIILDLFSNHTLGYLIVYIQITIMVVCCIPFSWIFLPLLKLRKLLITLKYKNSVPNFICFRKCQKILLVFYLDIHLENICLNCCMMNPQG